MRMGLFDTGRFIRGIRFSIEGEKIVFTADAPWAAYLEFGTYEFGMSFDEETWPPVPFPKKKDLSKSAREGFPRGMQPFASFRRVLYSQDRMERVIRRAVS